MIVFKGYRWTFLDLVFFISVIIMCAYFAIDIIFKEGLSLNILAGVIWGFGTISFILLYQFPIFGDSIEGDKLLKRKLNEDNAKLTSQEVKIVLGRTNHSDISPKTLKYFIIFFVFSGLLTLLGFFVGI